MFLQCWLTALSCSPGCSAGYDRDVPGGDSGSIKPLTPNMQKWFIPHLSDGMRPCKVAWIPVSFPRKAASPDSASFACPLSQAWPWKFIHGLCVFLSPEPPRLPRLHGSNSPGKEWRGLIAECRCTGQRCVLLRLVGSMLQRKLRTRAAKDDFLPWTSRQDVLLP